MATHREDHGIIQRSIMKIMYWTAFGAIWDSDKKWMVKYITMAYATGDGITQRVINQRLYWLAFRAIVDSGKRYGLEILWWLASKLMGSHDDRWWKRYTWRAFRSSDTQTELVVSATKLRHRTRMQYHAIIMRFRLTCSTAVYLRTGLNLMIHVLIRKLIILKEHLNLA